MKTTNDHRTQGKKLVFAGITLACSLLLLLLTSCAGSQVSPMQDTEIVQATEPPATSTDTPVIPTDTAQPTDTATPTDTPVPPTDTPEPTETPIPPTPTVDVEAALRSANILVFEDMFFAPYIKEALDEAGVIYTYVGDAIGKFKNEILSDTDWDLVIAAAEGRGGVAGEFFDYIKQQLDKGTSVIMEIWILNYIADGKIRPILDECGIDYQANWVNPSDRGIYWIDPDHPLAHEPNEVSLRRWGEFWMGDIGDLVQLVPGSQAQIVGGTGDSSSTGNGLITVCYDGRLIMQTFSTHDHPEEDMVMLWQNYIYYVIKNRATTEE